eukprot:SAG31_NODE_643_length_13291_cov_6.294042_5_plen_201_part_00
MCVNQVHRARLDDEQLVVKVQHRGVDKVMRQDLWQMNIIIRLIAYFEPQFDFRKVMHEWAEEAVKELDFNAEAANTNRARNSLMMNRPELDVCIPHVLPQYVRTRMMVMSFESGFSIKDTHRLDACAVDRVHLLETITRAFGHMIFVDGCFNCDPHPGNILVHVPPCKTSDSPSKEDTNSGKPKAPVDEVSVHARPVLLE